MIEAPAGRGRLLAGGVVWASTAQFFVAQALAQQAWKGSAPYSLRHSWISDLGATTCGSYAGGGGTLVCSPRHALLNASLALLGVQVVVGTLLLQPLLSEARQARTAVWLLVLAGAALPFVAGFPEDTGKPWHAVAATVHFSAAGLGTLAVGLNIRARHHRIGAITLALGGATLAGTLLTLAGSGAGVGRAAVERLAAWPFTAWTTIIGSLVVVAAFYHDMAPTSGPRRFAARHRARHQAFSAPAESRVQPTATSGSSRHRRRAPHLERGTE